ncbi:oxygen-dependent protoporphyrinogen oxidase [Podochytrium sp. JEL0797]|nr:oxygen-dependent protoporphyrinogen oxidase [Podochytrium sp. JEL0797]
MLVDKSSPAAKNRFIKYNGALNKMPTSLQEALFPPKNHVFRGVLARGAIEPFIPKTTKHDESIHDFVARRFASIRLAPLLPESSSLPALLSHNPAVTVAVVNLAYNDPNILPVSGFGYLTPRTQGGNTIGVIFDSEAIPGQGNSPGTTRITCMMGGHRFKELFPTPDSFSEEKCLQLAVESVRQDLGMTREPDSFTVSLHKECITQYKVGHSERMKGMHTGLRDEFGGRLAVCGMSYLGVGVNDCVLSARKVVERVVASEGGEGVVTGLERVSITRSSTAGVSHKERLAISHPLTPSSPVKWWWPRTQAQTEPRDSVEKKVSVFSNDTLRDGVSAATNTVVVTTETLPLASGSRQEAEVEGKLSEFAEDGEPAAMGSAASGEALPGADADGPLPEGCEAHQAVADCSMGWTGSCLSVLQHLPVLYHWYPGEQ